MKFKAVIIAVLAIIVAIVSIQNAAVVDLRFFTWEFSVSRILLILISFALGMAVGFLLSIKRPKRTPKKESVKEVQAPKSTPPTLGAKSDQV